MDFKEFKEKYEHIEVVEFSNTVTHEPVVTICVQTYQHAPYIKECLEGILMQKTDFSFEILLGEDGSKDGTRGICIDYAEKYPNKIRLFLHHRENNIQINGTPTGRFNYLYNLYSAKGKYIALCEGDDYWTDPLKLQKQVEFLEENEEYGLVHTSYKVLNQTTGKVLRKKYSDNNNKFFDLLIKNRIATLSTLFRADLQKRYESEINPLIYKWKMADYPMWLWMAFNSKIKLLPETTAVRRLVLGSVSNQPDISKQIDFLHSTIKIKYFFIDKYPCSSERLMQLKKSIITGKIKKAVLIQSYPLYKDAIEDKKRLNIKVSTLDKIYGLILRFEVIQGALSKLLMYRNKAI